MSKVKYQIFVSSTYDDLKEERDQVIKACLEMGHIPVGMEMFSAADEEQWQIITRQIDESDYYVVIIANRYGSIVKGVSYTEKEYDYAVEKGVPTLGFVLDSNAPWPSNRTETDKKAQTKLEAFKKKVKSKPVNFWTTKEELHGKCAIALSKTFNTQPRPGWIRSPDALGPEVAAELSRLSSENAKLREEVIELKKSSDISGLAQGDDEVKLRFSVNHYSSDLNSVTISTTWRHIFYGIAKFLIKKPQEDAILKHINGDYKQEAGKIVYHNVKTSDELEWFLALCSVSIIEADFEMIRTQFIALDLIQISHSNGENIWILTSQGQQQYINVAAIRRTKY